MCQIIHKIRDYTLPFDLIDRTCDTNPDGFGIMLFHQGKVIAEKEYIGDNDPQKIAEILEPLHGEEAFLHFRFRTKGAVSSENCHPFQIYNDFDREVYLMHNGTFHDFGGADKVDSEDFGEKIVGPLYNTFLKSGIRKPLIDPFFNDILGRYAPTGNKVVLLDNTGEHTIINPKSGDIYEDKEAGVKFWVSNTYSFQKYYRTPAANTYYGKNKGGSSQSSSPFPATNSGNVNGNATSTSKDAPTTTKPETGGTKSESGNSTKNNSSDKKVSVIVPEKIARPSYWKDVLNLDDIDDTLDMTFDDISDLVDIEPEHAKLFIKDLIYELYLMTYQTSPAAALTYEDSEDPAEEDVDPNEDTAAVPFEQLRLVN